MHTESGSNEITYLNSASSIVSRWGHHRQASLKRLATEKALDAQGAPKAVSPLTPSTHRLQLYFAGQEFPEHLARLRGVAAEECGHIGSLFAQGVLEVRGVQACDPCELLELRQLGLERGLPSLLPSPSLVARTTTSMKRCPG